MITAKEETSLKRFISSFFILLLILSVSVPSHAAEYEFTEIVTEVIEDSLTLISEKEVPFIPKDFQEQTIAPSSLIMPMYIPNERNFQKVGAKSHRIKLYGLDMGDVKVKVGTHDIDMTVVWYETWECDENGNKIRYISSTSKKLLKLLENIILLDLLMSGKVTGTKV